PSGPSSTAGRSRRASPLLKAWTSPCSLEPRSVESEVAPRVASEDGFLLVVGQLELEDLSCGVEDLRAAAGSVGAEQDAIDPDLATKAGALFDRQLPMGLAGMFVVDEAAREIEPEVVAELAREIDPFVPQLAGKVSDDQLEARELAQDRRPVPWRAGLAP